MPIQVFVLSEFESQDTWELSLLADQTQLSRAQLRDILCFWERKGILYEASADLFRVKECSGQGSGMWTNMLNPADAISNVNVESFSMNLDAEVDLSPLLPFILGAFGFRVFFT